MGGVPMVSTATLTNGAYGRGRRRGKEVGHLPTRMLLAAPMTLPGMPAFRASGLKLAPAGAEG